MLACREAKAQQTRDKKKQRKDTTTFPAAAAPVTDATTAATAAGCAGVPQAEHPSVVGRTPEQETRTTGKKRKAARPARKVKPPKAKKKKEDPPPVDVERQCGVPLPTGLLCARSLTCKCHTMGAKRAVRGRSRPYDVLLAAHRRRLGRKLCSTLHSFQRIQLTHKSRGTSRVGCCTEWAHSRLRGA